MYTFDDLNAVHSALSLLMNRQPPLVKLLARQPGTKEARYAHLLSGDVPDQAQPASAQTHSSAESSSSALEASVGATYSERLMELEREVADLRNEVAELKQQLAAFQKQFQ
jgi:hypothetical protein